MRRFTTIALLSAALVAPINNAFAAPEHGGTHAEQADGHGTAADGHGAAADSHGAAAEGHGDEGAHGDAAGGEAHHYYTDDDDGDGTANWLDSDSEQFMVKKLGFHAFNLFIYFAVMFFFVRRPLLDTLRSRALGIRNTIVGAAKHRDEAKEQHDEVTARLQALQDEIAAMKAEAAEESAVEAKRSEKRAHEEAERIAQTAQRNIRDEVARARLELRRDAVELAVQLAENTLKEAVSAEDQKRLAHDFLASLNDGASADA